MITNHLRESKKEMSLVASLYSSTFGSSHNMHNAKLQRHFVIRFTKYKKWVNYFGG
jgi:hypothetical protein